MTGTFAWGNISVGNSYGLYNYREYAAFKEFKQENPTKIKGNY